MNDRPRAAASRRAVPAMRLRVVSAGVIAATSMRSSARVPAHASRRPHTVAISRLAPPGHGSLATARWRVSPRSVS
jgi:hypothetical protein